MNWQALVDAARAAQDRGDLKAFGHEDKKFMARIKAWLQSMKHLPNWRGE